MKVSESGYTKDELLDIVDKYLAEQSRRWNFIEEKGDGMYVYDEEGNEYLDFFGGIAVNSTGNCNKKVAAAIADQCQNVIHASNYAYTLPMILLAKKICETIGMEKVLFQNSGTETNEAMIKMARKYGTDHYGPEHYHIVQPLTASMAEPMERYQQPDSRTMHVRSVSSRCFRASHMQSSIILRISRTNVPKTQLQSW